MFCFTFEYQPPKLVPISCFTVGSEVSGVMRNEDTVPVSIVGISGSLRKASFSTEILRVLARESTPAIDFHLVTLEEIPLYNEDLDREPGIPAVNALKQLISSCDGVLISTPEYNHGIPGVLKNALDWVSCPVFESCFKDKPVSIISSSKAFTGGVRAQYQLRETLISMHAQLVMGPEVVVGGVHRNFGDESYADEAGLAFMLKALNRLRDAALCQLKQLEMEIITDGETGIFYADSLAQAPSVHHLLLNENHNQARAKPSSPLPQAILRRVKEYMEEHLHDKLSLNDLARKTPYSRAHFLRMFRAATGKTPHQYLTERRIEQAKRILQEEKTSLIDTAARCGFSNQSHMTRVFREQVGVPPSVFRRKP
jgi:chromate reductase, NAD(P)H dehydrogenase (quinone)